jgi:[glutamine synthetase] adenylyltransferase / [glutamine synthetase]-adenylyl-L-tyrosine phosphorylase
MRREFASTSFFDPAKAEQNLARLEQQLAPTLITPLGSLLAHSPDPDGALNLLERFAEGAPADVLADLARYPTALTYLVAIFGQSAYLAEALLAEPGLTVQFARDRNFTKLKSKEDFMQDYARFATTSPDHWLSAQLARFKRRNFLRIVLKDVLGLSTLGETTFELSTLADVILANALTFCFQELEKRYGHPQYRDAQGRIVPSGFSIISLGKLGGNELNYSSDIDLLFLYGQDGETSGGSEPDSAVSNKEFFVRLAHAVTRSITQPTHQGEVFRVDLRLRPEGEQGDLAISLNSAAEYYKHRARDWELQMLIKARHSAGDAHLTREFLRRVETYIYGAPADIEAVESVLWARERISKKLRESRGEALDVKLHRGGIRDIEFLTQCLQRLRGGQDPWVRSGGTLFALRKLNDKGWLSDADFAALTACYEFFRQLEHRIQLEMGKQTHRLPKDPAALDRLARRVGAESDSVKISGAALVAEVRRRFARVDEIYQRLIHPPAAPGGGEDFRLEPVAAGIEERAHSYEAMMGFLDVHAAELAALVRESSPPERARRNVTKFLAALLGSSERFRLARREPGRIRQALEVASASDYLSDLMIYHPEDVAELGALEAATDSGAAQIEMGLEPPAQPAPFAWAAEENLDFREKMALLRRDYRSRVVALAAADLVQGGAIFPALGRWSALARRAVESALWIAAQSLQGDVKTAPEEMPFVVLGLGRLGLSEFDLASDADLVFVVSGAAAREEIPRWTRLAEKTIEVLSSYTRDGTVFVVDTRLRPRGQEGELVVTEDALLAYLAETAQVWESLTYLKANPVAGNHAAAERLVSRLVQTSLERSRVFPDLEGELHRMRRRLETEVIVPPSNTKTAPGGYYDVDFAVSYLRLKRRLAMAPGANAPERIKTLLAASALREDDARALIEGAIFLRTLDHAIRLCTGRPAEGLPEHVGHAEAVENLAQRWGLVKTGQTLAERLREIQQQVRYVYRRVLGSE